jgi:hypothetical protein
MPNMTIINIIGRFGYLPSHFDIFRFFVATIRGFAKSNASNASTPHQLKVRLSLQMFNAWKLESNIISTSIYVKFLFDF